MKDKSYSRIFYVETFILLFFFLAVIAVISRVLVGARAESIRARDLTNAVILAENAAEIAGASADPSEILALLGVEPGTDGVEEAALPMSIDLRCGDNLMNSSNGRYEVTLVWDREAHPSGALVTAEIRVTLFESGEELYTLSSGTYLPDNAGGEGGQS